MTTTFHQGNLRPTSGHKVGAEILNAVAGLGQVGANAYLDKQEREIEQRKYGGTTQQANGEQKPRSDRIDWAYEDLVNNGQTHFDKAKHYQRIGNKEQAKIEIEAGKRASVESAEARKANLKSQQENRKNLEASSQSALTYKQLGNINKKISDTRKVGPFFDRLGKNIKISDDGASLSWVGKLTSGSLEDQYVKAVNSLLNGAKGVFGARVTNFDVKAYLAQHPNLWQSEQGRKDVIDTLTIMNDLNLTHAKLKQQAYHDTKGMINPHIIDQRIDEFMAPMIEEAQRKLEEIVNRAEGSREIQQSQVTPTKDQEYEVDGVKYKKVGDKTYRWK